MEILLNPKRHDRPYPDERSREVMRKTIEFFERKGKRRLKEDYHARVWYADFLDFVKRERIFATMCTPAGYGARRRALGHLAHLRVRRDPRLLRPAVLVHLAGLGARPRPDLDEPQRGGQAARRAAARGRRRSSPSASRRRRTAPTSTRPTWCSRRATRASTPPAGASTTSATATRRRSSRPSASSPAPTTTSSSPPTRSTRATSCVQNVVRQPELRLRVRAARLPAHRGRHPAQGPRRLGRRAQHRQHRQVQPRLGLDRHLHARALRGDHARRTTAGSTRCASPTSRT